VVCLKTRPVSVDCLIYCLVQSGRTGPCCCCAGIGCGCTLGVAWVLREDVFGQECCSITAALCNLSRKMWVIKSVELLRSVTGAGLVLLLWESTFGRVMGFDPYDRYNPR
jgi:hypothetical protein